ncbi:MAG: hypothetical protein O6922_02405, partial [Chloroflexi bacterium]|nr:hypothetical protein [Chloroflexota bacterium]
MPGKAIAGQRLLALPGGLAAALAALAVVALLTGACQSGADSSPASTAIIVDDEVATAAVSPGAGEPPATRADAPEPENPGPVLPTSTASPVISESSPATTPEVTTNPTAASTSTPTPQTSPEIGQPTPTPGPAPLETTASPTAGPAGAGSSSPVSPAPTATPVFVPIPDEPDIPVPPDRDLQDLGRRLVAGYLEPKTIIPSEPFVVGQKVDFWVSHDQGSVIVSGEVVHISEHAYWIFDNRFVPAPADIRQVAENFESSVWPAVTEVFGTPLTPGIDGDDRIVVYHSILRAGVAGYFSAADSYPREIRPFSNQREAVYMSGNQIELTSEEYLSVIAHELQHASHFAADSSEDSWINEGLSEIAAEMAGFVRSAVAAFVRAPSTSLTAWPQDISTSRPNYGATNLFFAFLATHYGGNEMLTAVSRDQEDGIASIDSALKTQGFDVGANDVFADWLVANYLSAEDGPFSYENRSVPPVRNIYQRAPDSLSGKVSGYGANYVVTSTGSGRMTVEFQGQPETALLVEPPHSGATCWWSNQGDHIDSTLTRSVDLSSVETATLQFW